MLSWLQEQSYMVTGPQGQQRYNWKWSYSILSFLLLPHRFCVPKLYKRGLVRPVPKTWHCLWLQCQRHNQRGQSESECPWPRICCSGALGKNTFRRDWLILWFNSSGAIAIGGFQYEYFLQMIGSDCSGWNFSSWFYNKFYWLNRRRDLSFGVGWSLPGRQVKMWLSVPLQRSYFMTLKTMYTIGYCTSLVTLMIALVVLASFRWGEASLVCVWPGLLVISADTNPSIDFLGKLKIEVYLKTFTEISDKIYLRILSPRRCQGCSLYCALLFFPNCSWMHVANGICTNSLLSSSHDFSVP